MSNDQKFNYIVGVGYPNDYGMVYESRNSYLMDERGTPILHFGGGIAAEGFWGRGTQNTGALGKYPAPSGIKIRWFSVRENQFWEAESKLPNALITRLFTEKFEDVFSKSKGKYNQLIVNVAPDGLVAVWIGGERQKIQLVSLKAKKIDMPWDEFNKESLGRRVGRAEFTESAGRKSREKQSIIFKNYGEFLAGKDRWDYFQRKYNYKVSVNDKFILKDYLCVYMNGEKYYTYAKDTGKITQQAMPYQIYMYIEREGVRNRIALKYRQDEMAKIFQKILGDNSSEPVDFHIEIAENLESIDSYLISKGQKYKITIKSAAIIDLYNNSTE